MLRFYLKLIAFVALLGGIGFLFTVSFLAAAIVGLVVLAVMGIVGRIAPSYWERRGIYFSEHFSPDAPGKLLPTIEHDPNAPLRRPPGRDFIPEEDPRPPSSDLSGPNLPPPLLPPR
jgi:hypothetical protein